jgi:hypothetical protein
MPAQRSVPMRPTDKNYPKQAMSVALDKMKVFYTGLTPEVGIRELLNWLNLWAAFCDLGAHHRLSGSRNIAGKNCEIKGLDAYVKKMNPMITN